MNKTELSAKVATKLNLSEGKGTEVVNAVLDVITDALVLGEEVNITGFGKFEPVKTQARLGRNPKTWEAIGIPAKTVVKFRPGKTLKESVI